MEEESGGCPAGALAEAVGDPRLYPDYGIDGAVEIFEFTDDTEMYAETLGESFLFQLKSAREAATSAPLPCRDGATSRRRLRAVG